jgi:hypothetical protein
LRVEPEFFDKMVAEVLDPVMLNRLRKNLQGVVSEVLGYTRRTGSANLGNNDGLGILDSGTCCCFVSSNSSGSLAAAVRSSVQNSHCQSLP